MKYIDADLLRKEIEKNTPDRLQVLVYRDIILALIDSLQQERQEVDAKMRTGDKLEMEKLYGEEY